MYAGCQFLCQDAQCLVQITLCTNVAIFNSLFLFSCLESPFSVFHFWVQLVDYEIAY